jgi:hypothetical protein
MSDVETPFTIELSEEQINDLQDGETVKIIVEEREGWHDELRIEWYSVGEMGEAGKELVSDLKSVFDDE